MADLTLAQIQALLPDNTTGLISAEDVRDVSTALFERTDGTNAVGALLFDTTPTVPGVHTPGHMHWNTTEGVPEVMTATDGVTLQLGHELYVDVRNNSGATILNGRPVRITGGIGTRPTIALDNGLGNIVGVATHDIVNNSNGKVTAFGLVRDINTSAFTDGVALYASATGTLTTAITSSFVGYVTDAAVTGHLLVSRVRTDSASGTTAQRPTVGVIGFRYFDTTLGIPIFWNGAAWVNASGGVV
jgi:hypothetical protein